MNGRVADDEDEQASGGLNHLVPRNDGGGQWTRKKVNVVVDSGAAENVMSMFTETSTEETERSKNGEKDSKDQEESTSRITGSNSCPSELVVDLYARTHGRSQT